MDTDRRKGIAAGVLFLVTEVAAVAGLTLYRPLLDGTDYVLGAGADNRVLLGALCEVVLALAVAGTGVTLFPVLRRRHEGLALGYVCVRLLEAVVIVLGLVSVLAVVTLRREAPAASDAGASSFAVAAKALIAVHDWTFLLGPNLILGVNTLMLAVLLHRTGAVPRVITVLGLVGGPLICASAVAVLFGRYAQLSGPGTAAAVPVFAWELSLAGWLVLRGFRGASVGAGEFAAPALDAEAGPETGAAGRRWPAVARPS
ncbi:DUF4386 domain-containing protein [Kitasatospora sp. NBC_01246]|uniref:DUF4386 domain-containing protein n=1 Tax=Kitasatospora sp. NBC_01246 TaxID=2903570 RepID=UPI002E36CE95|nr:DUF4386 domain-containing protein [Kitasatospora sp. NBC_01246]